MCLDPLSDGTLESSDEETCSDFKDNGFCIVGSFLWVSSIDWLAEGSEILTRAPLTKLSYQQQEEAMAKRLSEQLADLSVQAKNAEDAVIAAEKEAHDKVVARKEQARVAASAAVQKVSEEIKSANDTAAQNWSAVKAKVAADLNGLKANIAQAKHDLGAERAENYAEELEWEAGVAIDYAIASVQQARYAVLDAVASRAEAEQAKRA